MSDLQMEMEMRMRRVSGFVDALGSDVVVAWMVCRAVLWRSELKQRGESLGSVEQEAELSGGVGVRVDIRGSRGRLDAGRRRALGVSGCVVVAAACGG